MSKLSSVSLQAAARPSTSARKSERVLGAWVVLGWCLDGSWLVGSLVGWLVGWLVKKKDVLVVSVVPGLFPYFLFSKHSRKDRKSENMLGFW